MSHTPGPWEVDRTSDRLSGPIRFRRIVSWEHDASGFGCTICHVKGRWNMKYGEESGDEISPMQESDARLIAAAPELLAALQEVEWYYDSMGGMECPWCLESKEHGHASDCPRRLAIAKATNDA